MTTLTLQLPDAHSIYVISRALETYAQRLQNSVARTQRKLNLLSSAINLAQPNCLRKKQPMICLAAIWTISNGPERQKY